MEYIDFRSDTLTLPSQAMKEAMLQAPLGDDVLDGDPSVRALEEYAAKLFGHAAAMFCTSGTQCNQIALQVHTNPLESVICHQNDHIIQYETGGYAHLARISTQTKTEGLKLDAVFIEQHINADHDWLAKTSLVSIENSCNLSGGLVYSMEEMQAISNMAGKHKLAMHLDGARIFNALTYLNLQAKDIGKFFDSISICLSKGLGAPVGSVLLGSTEFIKKARRFRKVMGGSMRQAGMLAAAGQYALEHHIPALARDHQHAQQLAATLSQVSFVHNIRPVQTNIVIAELANLPAAEVVKAFSAKGIRIIAMGDRLIRFVTHRDISDEMMERAIGAIASLK